MMCSGWTFRILHVYETLGNHPAGGNVDPELKGEVWIPVQRWERSLRLGMEVMQGAPLPAEDAQGQAGLSALQSWQYCPLRT